MYGVRLHAELADADGAVARHRPPDRRCDRGAREHRAPHRAWARTTATAALDGTDEIGLAVMATTFCDRRGVRAGRLHGRHHRPLLLPVRRHGRVAVLVSLFVCFTLDPMLSSRLARPAEDRTATCLARPRHGRVDAGIERAARVYRPRARLGARAGRKTTMRARARRLRRQLRSARRASAASSCRRPTTASSGRVVETPVGSSLEYTEAQAQDRSTRRCASSRRSTTPIGTVGTGDADGNDAAAVYREA